MSTIYAICYVLSRFFYSVKQARRMMLCRYAPASRFEVRLNRSAIVSVKREPSTVTGDIETFHFSWTFQEPFNLYEAELLYKGKVWKHKTFNHRFHAGDTLDINYTFHK